MFQRHAIFIINPSDKRILRRFSRGFQLQSNWWLVGCSGFRVWEGWDYEVRHHITRPRHTNADMMII